VLFMDLIAEIRRRHLVSKESISSIARDLNLSRPTVVAPTQPVTMDVPDMLKLEVEPLADCGRYDRLRGVAHVIH